MNDRPAQARRTGDSGNTAMPEGTRLNSRRDPPLLLVQVWKQTGQFLFQTFIDIYVTIMSSLRAGVFVNFI